MNDVRDLTHEFGIDMDESILMRELENLIVDNPELERLEALLDQFNNFEALNAVRVEIRPTHILHLL